MQTHNNFIYILYRNKIPLREENSLDVLVCFFLYGVYFLENCIQQSKYMFGRSLPICQRMYSGNGSDLPYFFPMKYNNCYITISANIIRESRSPVCEHSGVGAFRVKPNIVIIRDRLYIFVHFCVHKRGESVCGNILSEASPSSYREIM